MGKIRYTNSEKRKMNQAMQLSFAVGCFMLLLKSYAWWITGSAAILSDAAESIVHVLAVGFAAYSMWLSHKPADVDHTYGHDRITFFSAGFEGALIIIAALYIMYQAVMKLIRQEYLENLEAGMAFILIATILNGFLGMYLVRLGKKYTSLVLEADGKHILTDCATSLGVVIALILVHLTGWQPFDPIIALIIALNIFYTGFTLIWDAIRGLMDRTDPIMDSRIRELLNQETAHYHIQYHKLRHRNAGNRLLIEVHLLFPKDHSIARSHEVATQIEKKLETAFSHPTELVTHLEPLEGHDEVHSRVLGREG